MFAINSFIYESLVLTRLVGRVKTLHLHEVVNGCAMDSFFLQSNKFLTFLVDFFKQIYHSYFPT